MIKRISFIFLALLFSTVTNLGAEDRVFRFITYFEGAQKEKALGSLISTLTRSTDKIILIPMEITKDKPIPEEKALKSLIQRKSCDGVLYINLAEVPEGWSVSVRLKVPGEEKPRYESVTTKAVPSWSDTAEIFWLYLLGDLDAFLTKEGGTIPKPLEALTSQLTIKGVPGTLVKGLTKEPFLIPAEGQIKIEVNFPASYFIENTVEGYRTTGLTLFLTESEKEILLSQTQEKTWTAEYFHQNLNFPGIEGSWYFFPGRGSVTLGLNQYLLGFVLKETESKNPAPSLVTSLPLIQLNAGGNWFFSPPTDIVRFNAGLTVGLRFITSPFFGLDTIMPVAFQPYGGLEYRPLERLGVDVQVGSMIYAPIMNTKAFQALAGKSNYGFSIGESVGVEPLYIRVGLRWYIW